MLRLVKQRILDMKIKTKFILLSLCVFLITVSSSCYFYIRINSRNVISQVSELNIQTLGTINDNIGKEIKNASNLSKIFLANDLIQDVLRNPGSLSDFQRNDKIASFIGSLRNSVPIASSVYIYDLQGNSYYTDRYRPKTLAGGAVQQAVWYGDIMDKNGKYILRLNADDAFQGQAPLNYVSLIRIIQDLNTMQPIGALILNIDEQVFRDCYHSVAADSQFNIALVDERGQFIVPFSSPFPLEEQRIAEQITGGSGSYIEAAAGKEYLVSYKKMEDTGWTTLSILPIASFKSSAHGGMLLTILIIVLNGALLVGGSIIIIQWVIRPLNRLGKAMMRVENYEFKKVNLNVGNNEIGYLQGCYNIMITEIEHLISEIVREQSSKRQQELNLLQAQFTPHFLYNTIDVVRSMVMTGRNQEANQMLKAMGGYYRICLSKGRHLIRLDEEVQMIRNYMAIQEHYFGETVSVTYDIDESAASFYVLKFILQPLVENAVKHGIQPLGEPGEITISASLIDGDILLCVEDNGVGMSEEEISRILLPGSREFTNSFGLRGTVERLRLFYERDDVFSLESREGAGTRVTVRIPARTAANSEGGGEYERQREAPAIDCG